MTSTLDDARGELLACPFCNRALEHDPTISLTRHPKMPYEEYCPLGHFSFCSDRRDIISAWNTRAAPVPQCDAESATLRAQLAELERLRNIGQAMLDALPIGAVVTIGGRPIDHSKLGEVRNELRAALSPDQGTVA